MSKSVTMNYKESDYFRYQVFKLLCTKWIAWIIMFGLPIYGIYSIFHSGKITVFDAYLVSMPIFVLLLLWIRNSSRFRNLPLLRLQEKFTFNENGISIQSEQMNLEIKWDNVYRFYSTKNLFIIGLSPIQGFVINKSNFEKADIDVIESIINNYLSKSVLRKYSWYPF